MIRVKDIANMVGVSPTTVSNVIHGNTKRVSQETAQKISSILDEVGYIPNMGARLLSQNTSHIIGLVIGFDYLHGENAMQDPFVSTFVGQISSEIENAGYYMMIIRGDDCRKVAEVTSSKRTVALDIKQTGVIQGLSAPGCRHWAGTGWRNSRR